MNQQQTPYFKSRAFAIFIVIAASLMLLLAVLNLIINTQRVGTWLPLLIIMPFSLWVGIQSLRAQNANRS